MLRRFRSKFHDDWCGRCAEVMEIKRKQLYAMPEQLVGHYVSHSDADYYKTHLTPVRGKGDIPAGMYACGLILYRCPYCAYTAVKVCVFLPVRDAEKPQDYFYFDHGELDSFVRETVIEPQEEPPKPNAPGSLSGKRVIRSNYSR